MAQRQGVTTRGIGLELSRHRKISDMTLEHLSAQLGISVSTLSRLENGKRDPSSEEVATILAILGVTGGERDRLLDMARGGIGSSGMVEHSNPPCKAAPTSASKPRLRSSRLHRPAPRLRTRVCTRC